MLIRAVTLATADGSELLSSENDHITTSEDYHRSRWKHNVETNEYLIRGPKRPDPDFVALLKSCDS